MSARLSRRPGVRATALLAAATAVLPLAALPARSAAAVPLSVPVGRPALAPEPGDCSKTAPGTLINQTPPGLDALGAGEANTVATGRNVLVAVVDSGVDNRNVHLDAPGVVQPGLDISGARTPNGWTDTEGHGTAIAGLIAARAVKGSLVVGLAPNATILPIRVYTRNAEDAKSSQTQEYPPTSAAIGAGIQAAANAGAKIINVSMSTPVNDPELRNAVSYATRRGALVVASAGNRATSENKSDDARYPGAYPDALAVSATDNQGIVTDDSIHGSYVDVAAPGTDIYTSYFGAGDCVISVESASTSYATAYVSAAAALIAEAHPDETPAQWRYRLEVTAIRARPDTRDDYAGWGIVQPYEALTFVSDGTAAGPRDPAATAPPSQAPVEQSIAPVVRAVPDHTDRDQTLWITLGGVVVVLALALVALLRRDRNKGVRPPPKRKTPAGVR